MENWKRCMSKNTRRADPRTGTSLDDALAIVWRVVREFPDARQALQAALGDLLKKDDEVGGDDGVK